MESLLSSRLHSWERGELMSMWIEARFEADQNLVKTSHISLERSNNLRALRLAKAGRYGDATRALTSEGCASNDDTDAFNDLLKRLPQCSLPTSSEDTPSALTVD